jgi:metallo-beta-lactamase class B
VRLGEIAMTPILTPGHTQGCTTWSTTVTEGGKPLDVVFLCSVTAPGYILVNNDEYPKILEDYGHSFDRLRGMRADIFLANHGSFFGLMQKLERKKQGGANPFIDAGELSRYLERAWKALQSEVAKQRASSAPVGTR